MTSAAKPRRVLIIVEDLPAGRVIFKEGERDNRTVYLLAGEITLFSGTAQAGSVGRSPEGVWRGSPLVVTRIPGRECGCRAGGSVRRVRRA